MTPASLVMAWNGKRFVPRGMTSCACLTGRYCSAQCRDAHYDLHKMTVGHKRYMTLMKLSSMTHVLDLHRKVTRYLRVLEGYEYGWMPLYWR